MQETQVQSLGWEDPLEEEMATHSSILAQEVPWTVAHQASLWDFPSKNTGVGCHFLLQGIFPTQGSYPCPLHWQIDSLPLSHQGCQRIYIGHKTNHMSKKLLLHSPQFFLFMKIK